MTARQPFAEFRDVSVTDPLRQGDVIEAVDAEATKWRRHLLVITADCDFARAKHQGRVTCVPLLTQDEYLLEFQVPRIRDDLLSKTSAALTALISKSGGRELSKERVREWAVEQTPDEIVAALDLDVAQSGDVLRLLSAIRLAAQLPGDLDSAVSQLVTAQVEVPNGKNASNARRDVTQKLTAHYKNPPGDALFLSSVAPRLDAGYFVYLRHLEQIRESEIVIGPSRSPATYRRLSRLQDRFIHAVSQQFAMVFMAIGLPREYEEIRDLHCELLGDRYQ